MALSSTVCLFFVLTSQISALNVELQGASLLTVSRLANNQTVLRIKTLGTELPVEQANVNLQGDFTLLKLSAPQHLRRVQLTVSGDFADLRDDGELIISLADTTFQQFDLSDESCSDAAELYTPSGLSNSIVLLITCTGGRVLCAKYSNGMYTIDSIFVSEYVASTPVIVTVNGISTAIYTVLNDGASALAIRSLEPNGYEQFRHVNTFYDTFGSCMESLSYNETHVRLSCPNTNNFYLVDGSGEQVERVYPQDVGDVFNIYNEDMVLVINSSFVTVNANKSTDFCTLNLPSPIIRVDYVRTNGKLLVLFFSSHGLYQYDASKPCMAVSVVTLVNETLLGLNGDYQNYLIFSDILVYTVIKNGFYYSVGIDLTTSQNLGIFADHPYHPLIYGIVKDNSVTIIKPTTTTEFSVLITSTSTLSFLKTMKTSTIKSASSNVVMSPEVANTPDTELPVQLIITIVPVIVLIVLIIFLLVVLLSYIIHRRGRATKHEIGVELTDHPHSPTVHMFYDEYLVTHMVTDRSVAVTSTDDKFTGSPPSDTAQNGSVLN